MAGVKIMTTKVREGIFNEDPGIGPGSLNGIRLFYPDSTEETFRENLEELQIWLRQDLVRGDCCVQLEPRRSMHWSLSNYMTFNGHCACCPSAWGCGPERILVVFSVSVFESILHQKVQME